MPARTLRKWPFRPTPTRSYPRPQRLFLEPLEERIVPALQQINIGGLTFYGDFDDEVATNGIVQVGLTPLSPPAFKSLLEFDLRPQNGYASGKLVVSKPNQNFQFLRASVNSVIQGPNTLTIWQNPTPTDFTTWSVASLLGTSGVNLDATPGLPFSVFGVSFILTGLSLATEPDYGDEVKMQGKVTFPNLAKVDLSRFEGTVARPNYLIAQEQTSENPPLRLTGMTAAFTGESFNLGDLTATVGTVAVTYSNDNGHDTFGFNIGGEVSTKPQDDSQTKAINGVGFQVNLTLSDGALVELGGRLQGQFQLFGVDVEADPNNPPLFDAKVDSNQNEFDFSGGLRVTIPTKNPSTVDFRLGYSSDTMLPGIKIIDGVLHEFNATVSGQINLAELQILSPNGLNFSYNRADEQFEMFGDLILKVPKADTTETININALMGNQANPGLLIKQGELEDFNMTLSGQFSLFGLSLLVSNAGLKYDHDLDQYAISGTITAPTLWNATVSLGTPSQPGFIIRHGTFHLDQFSIGLSNINIGVFVVQQLKVSYSQPDPSIDPTIDAQAFLLFPGGWGVYGDITFDGDKVKDITLAYTAGSSEGIEIGDTGLAVTYLEASVQNIDDPHNLIVSGNLAVDYGGSITIYDPLKRQDVTVTLFSATGGFTVDRNHLQLSGSLYLGAYSIGTDGNGMPIYQSVFGIDDSATVDLDWGARRYLATTSLSLFLGTIDVEGVFAFDQTGDIVLAGKAELKVPSEIPIIGGKYFGSVDFLFEYHKHDLDNSFFAAWTEFEIPIIDKHVKIGIKYDVRRSHLSFLSGKQIDAFDGSFNNPDQRLDDNGDYIYYSSYTAPTDPNTGAAIATGATFLVDWPSPGGNQYVSVTLPDGTTINQSDFNPQSTPIGISVVAGLSTSTQTVVHLTSSGPDVTLPIGNYTLTLHSNRAFDPVTSVLFNAAFHYPEPTIDPVILGIIPTDGTSLVNVTLQGTVDEGFKDATRVSLYVDVASDPNNRRGVPVKLATALPITTDGQGNWTLNTTWDLSGLTPNTPYYLYAIINDGTNAQVSTGFSAAVVPKPPVYGQVTDVALGHNNQPLPGIQVYLDLNHNGVYDPSAVAPPPIINAGGGPVGTFGADNDSTGGQTDATTHSIGIQTQILNPAPEAVYQTNRYGNDFSYVIPGLEANTPYQIRLHFAETVWNAPGERVFNVAINGETVLSEFDIFAEAAAANDGRNGKFLAVVRTFLPTTDANGAITIHFTTEADNAQVNGIELLTNNGGLLLGINAGSFFNPVGNFQTDQYYFGNSSGDETGDSVTIPALIPNPAPEAVYQSRRYDSDFSYIIPGLAANASYAVRLHFAETELTQAGDRIFSVAINGQTVLSHFDIFAQAAQANDGQHGQFLAVVRTVIGTTDANGALTIQFTGETYNAQINGIEIIDFQVPATGEPTSVTHTDGFYSFWNVVPYLPVDVAVVIPTTGFILSSDSPLNTNPRTGLVYDGTHPVSADFGLIKLPSISGTVFIDGNQDGHFDAGDAGLGLWAVFLDANGNQQLDDGEVTAITTADGSYSFLGLIEGTYQVSILIPQGYYPTSPVPLPFYTININPTTSQPYPQVENVNFGALPYVTISGNVSSYTLQNGALSSTTTPTQGQTVYLLARRLPTEFNAGGPAVADFEVDQGFQGATQAATSTIPITTSYVTTPAPQTVYQSNRYGTNFTYTIGGLVAGAPYRVRLHFAELYWNSPGNRIFDVTINGQPVLLNYDIFAEAQSIGDGVNGQGVAVAPIFNATAEADGTVTIHFLATKDNAQINGIEIIPQQTATVATNAGGNADGNYQSDTGSSGGNNFFNSANIDTSLVADPAPLYVYQTMRYGASFSYTLSGFAPNVTHLVRLHFVEHFYTQTGQRRIDVQINGQQVLNDYDIFGAAGARNRAVTESFTAIADGNGQIHLSFVGVGNEALVNAIEVSEVIATTTTDANGNYAFSNQQAGTYRVAQATTPGRRQIAPFDSSLQLQTPQSPSRPNTVIYLDGPNNHPTSVAAADFDGDGTQDFAVLNPTGTNDNQLQILYSAGNGNLLTLFEPTQDNLLQLDTGDFYGTGRQDIAILTQFGGILVVRNDQFGDLDNPGDTWYPTTGSGLTAYGMAIGRFVAGIEHDQIALLYKADADSATRLAFLYVDGSGTVQSIASPELFEVIPRMIVAGNVFGNGLDEVLIGSPDSSPVLAYYNGGMIVEQSIDSLPAGGTVVMGDINGDGLADLGVFDSEAAFHYALQDGAGNFNTVYATDVGRGATNLNTALLRDVTGDFKPDLVFSSCGNGSQPTLWVALNTGQTGNWFTSSQQTVWNLAPGGQAGLGMDIGDFNGDGLNDIVVTDQAGGFVQVVYNKSIIAPQAIIVSVVAADSTSNNFINVQMGQINGRIFDDATRDGNHMLTKPARQSITVYVDRNNNGRLDPREPRTLTTPEGYYAFSGLTAGNHQVRWIDESNRRATTFENGVHTARVRGRNTLLTKLDFGNAITIDHRLAIPANGSRSWTVSVNGDRLEVLDSVLGVIDSQPLEHLKSLTITGSNGRPDRLTIDMRNGSFTLPGGIIFDGGSGAGDELQVLLGAGNNSLTYMNSRLEMDNQLKIRPSRIERLVIDTGAGDDRVSLFGMSFRGVVQVYGGDGSDVLRGGNGNDILLGGAGDDFLFGMGGRDLLIGGLGRDLLNGGGSDDMLIGGSTTLDEDKTALEAVMAEWASQRSYASRILNLQGMRTGGANRNNFLNAETVHNDNTADQFFGGTGRDWFLAYASDLLSDRRSNERIGV